MLFKLLFLFSDGFIRLLQLLLDLFLFAYATVGKTSHQITNKKPAIKPINQNVRVLECGQWQQRQPRLDFKRVNGVCCRSRSWNGWFG